MAFLVGYKSIRNLGNYLVDILNSAYCVLFIWMLFNKVTCDKLTIKLYILFRVSYMSQPCVLFSVIFS